MNELLGRRIKELRSAKNFTQEQMATQIGVSRQKYARLESGINSITLDLLSKIAKILDVTVADITKVLDETPEVAYRVGDGDSSSEKIFDMIDAVALHQQKKALDLYYDLLALKEAPMRILFLLSSQFQRLMIVKSMTNQGFGNKEIASKAGCPEWAVRKYQSQSRAFSMDQLKQAIRDGVEYETSVKTGHMNDQMAVELFLVQYSTGK